MVNLITGGAGFIGSHLTKYLMCKEEEVIIIDNLSTGKLQNLDDCTSHSLFKDLMVDDIRSPRIEGLIKQVDVVYHLAAGVGVKRIIDQPIETIETNILGTANVLKYAARYNKPIFIASSSEVYGKSHEIPFKEDGLSVIGGSTKSRWSYACSKLMDEFLSLAYHKEKGLPVIIGRLFNVIGSKQTGRYGMVVPTFTRQALKNEPITVYGDGCQTRCFTYIDDVIYMIEQTMQRRQYGEVYNIGSDKEISIIGLALLIRELLNSKSEIIKIPYKEAYEEGFEDMDRRVPDLTKIKLAINYEPRVSLKQAIKNISLFYGS